jgi:NTP pyrophosphatase (non-canonical NTP hydrolase)
MEFSQLQEEVYEWSENNFPGQPAVNPHLGTSEEVGELADRVDFGEKPTEEELDAIGDILVYLADFCGRRNLDYQQIVDEAEAAHPTHSEFYREWVAARGDLSRSLLKQRQDIRTDEERVGKEAEHNALVRLVCALDAKCGQRGYTLEDAIDVAWNDEVSDRSWDSSYSED